MFVSIADANDVHRVVQGRQVQALAECPGREGPLLPENLTRVTTPLDSGVWARELEGHPDQVLVREILRGIKEGFKVGYDHTRAPLRTQGTNMPSATEHSSVVEEYLAGEVEAGRVALAGTPQQAKALGIHCSPFGVIPKKSRPGKFRLILNLSAPEGASVNDGISKELASLSYVTLDEVAGLAARLGRGAALLVKMDIKQAYRQESVHPADGPLLGMLWKDKVFVDTTLPFGLRSAPLLFTALADAAQWVMKRHGTSHVFHYVDDFITMGADLAECTRNNAVMHETCDKLGLPPEPAKNEGPATCITFLGIDIDTVAMELRLPEDKLIRLTSDLAGWRGRKACRKPDLLSLIGTLSHACKVIRAGRTFMRRLIELSTTAKKPEHFVRLSREARSDIEWWWQFSTGWNGVKLLRGLAEVPSITLESDASGWWGCGAYWGSRWFQLPWAGQTEQWYITAKELVPIVIATVLWGREWRDRTVLARCDNTAVVSIIGKGSSRDREAMHLARCLAFVQAEFEVALVASHIREVENVLADALSRNEFDKFHNRCPQAAAEPTSIPEALLDLLLIKRPDWTCPSWTELWSATVRAA